MRYKSWDGTREIELDGCPCCGCDPVVRHIGNDHTKRREIKIKCSGCRLERTDAAIRHGFDFLEDITARYWNKRV